MSIGEPNGAASIRVVEGKEERQLRRKEAVGGGEWRREREEEGEEKGQGRVFYFLVISIDPLHNQDSCLQNKNP